MFSSQSDNCTPFVHIFDIISLFATKLEEPKIGIRGKGLRIVGEYVRGYLSYGSLVKRLDCIHPVSDSSLCVVRSCSIPCVNAAILNGLTIPPPPPPPASVFLRVRSTISLKTRKDKQICS